MSWLDDLYQINTGSSVKRGGKANLSIDPERFGDENTIFNPERFEANELQIYTIDPVSNSKNEAAGKSSKGKSGEKASEVCETCCEIITGTMLKKIFTTAPIGRLNAMADELNYNINIGKIDSVNRLTHFLGQVREEAGSGAILTEDLYYSSSTLKKTYKHYRKNPELADQHGKFVVDEKMKKYAIEHGLPEPSSHSADPEKIANTIYDDANRDASRKLGNTETGDGWKYRGRGLKQLTGRYNYTQFNKGYPNYWADEPHDFVEQPELVAEIKYAVRSALWFWLEHDLAAKADGGISDDVTDSITDIINNGTPSASKRRDHVNDIKKQDLFKKLCFNTSKNLSNYEAKEPK